MDTTPSLLQSLRTHQGRTWRIISGPGAGSLVQIAKLTPEEVITRPVALTDETHSFLGTPAEFASCHMLFSKPQAH